MPMVAKAADGGRGVAEIYGIALLTVHHTKQPNEKATENGKAKEQGKEKEKEKEKDTVNEKEKEKENDKANEKEKETEKGT